MMAAEERATEWRSGSAALPSVGLGNPIRPLLSGRQLEVIRHKAYGCTTFQIARELHLSEFTVRNHLARAYRAAGVTCIVELVRALGWLVIPDD